MRRPTILLADDHLVFTGGIARILLDRFDIVGTVTDGAALVEAAARLHPDVIVADISMPVHSGLEALRRLNETRHDSTRVVFLTMHTDARLAAEAFRLGASGFVLKQSSGEELVKALDAALQGRRYLSPSLVDEVQALL
jgi:DNA-binding NarL/FixJ family response regulator